jgi:hypothetical protein
MALEISLLQMVMVPVMMMMIHKKNKDHYCDW